MKPREVASSGQSRAMQVRVHPDTDAKVCILLMPNANYVCMSGSTLWLQDAVLVLGVPPACSAEWPGKVGALKVLRHLLTSTGGASSEWLELKHVWA